jgi:hypothetical protein
MTALEQTDGSRPIVDTFTLTECANYFVATGIPKLDHGQL